jgi:Fic family protein
MTIIETPDRLEPMLLADAPLEIADALADLAAATAALGANLHPLVAKEATDLVRVMNCYYSNLIEGHATRPREIARAVEGDFSEDPALRDLQLEALAHIKVQTELDEMAVAGRLPDPASQAFIKHLHETFYAELPESMRLIKGAHVEFLMAPGAFRSLPLHDVEVGRHVPPSSERVPAFMDRFSKVYAVDHFKPARLMLATPAAHHRFAYIHPFPDGNGRVVRLLSHAMILRAGYGAHGLWSISRGLARGLPGRPGYKAMLAHADSPRQGGLDGRGNLSLKALQDWTLWFLEVCIVQARFMGEMFDLNRLLDRLERMIQIDRDIDPAAFQLLRQAAVRGEFQRGEAGAITGLGERSARYALSHLLTKGLLTSDTPKGPVRLAFPVDHLDQLFPRLFMEV